ncbi:MAG: bifunctional indole-3-glycerol-phosphate synthase TrpC/phosphoribosylanthranilate isomerase TrpF [Aestuariibacter sp.]
MENVLQKIVADTRLTVEKRKQSMPLTSFVTDLTSSKKSLFSALSQPDAGFIFECKKASPSKGLIRENFDLDEIIAAYEPYAAGISVLTDEKYFQGSYDYLEYVTSKVTQPVLNKDFFIDEYQVHLARKYQADAILLMLSVLSDAEYQHLAAVAAKYDLDILTEVSNEEEALRAVKLQANIIGINNRNLRDLSTDLSTTEKLAPLIAKHAKHAFVLISESGIYSNQDVRRLSTVADGFLVGSSLMAEQDLTAAVQRLVYGAIKVCGITRLEDVKVATQLGASYAGLIFAQQSKRRVSLTQAKTIVNQKPFRYVGVFVNEDPQQVANIANELQLHAVQLHGQENQSYIDDLRTRLNKDCAIWLAKGVHDRLPPLNELQVDRFLLDCQVGDQSGGTGQAFDWQLLDQIPDRNNVILAGGLKPDNIALAAGKGVAILDINSGVESAPGIKDSTLLKHAFEQLRHY